MKLVSRLESKSVSIQLDSLTAQPRMSVCQYASAVYFSMP